MGRLYEQQTSLQFTSKLIFENVPLNEDAAAGHSRVGLKMEVYYLFLKISIQNVPVETIGLHPPDPE